MTEIAPKASTSAEGPSSSSPPYHSQSPSTSKGERSTPNDTPASTQDQTLQRPRTRKRSLFGRAAKPSTPSEPLPALPQNVNKFESTTRNEDIPLVSPSMEKQDDSLTIPTKTPSERSPVRNFILRRQGHGRSPSTSALPSPPPTGFTSYDDPLSSPSPSESLQAQDISKQEFREGSSQSLGRKGGAMSVANPSSNWYNRGPMAKAHMLSNAIVRGRDRSASVSASPQPAKKHDRLTSNGEKDSNLYRVPESIGLNPPSSPLNLRRSFSRRSIYSLRGDQSTSEISEGSHGQRDAQDTTSTPNAKPRRRLFGRPGSRAIDVSTSSNSNSIAISGNYHDDRSSSDHSSGNPFKKVHNVNSNSMLRAKNGSAGLDPMASTDSLASNSASSISRGITRRAGEMIQKSTSLANWGRKSRSTINVAEDIEEQPTSAPASSESEARAPSVSEFGATKINAMSSSSPSLHTNATEAGLPKRLSGWIYNMLGNDAEQANTNNDVGIQVSDSTATLRQIPEGHQRDHDSTLRGSQDGNAKNTSELSKSANKDNEQPTITTRSRTAGLLSALAVSGRNRMDGNTPNAANSNPSNNNAIGSGVGVARSGLDRALRYFIDNSEQDSDAEVGAWLLGVWHGPSEDNTTAVAADMTSKFRPAIEVSDAIPEREQIGRASTNAEATTSSSKIDSEHGHEDDSSIASSAQRTRETSPSIASASSRGSASKKKSSNKIESDEVIVGEDAQIVARNPPTPQTSPIISQMQVTSSPSSSRKNRRTMQAAESAASLTNALRSNADNQVSFQSDFSSRIWCTYRSHFTPIARDGTISDQAENAAALAAVQLPEGARATPQKQSNDGSHSSVASTSTPSRNAQHLSTSQMSLGNAFGISPPTSSSPSNSGQGGGGGIGLGERMGIPNLWNRATAAAQAYGLAGRSGLTTDAGWGCMLRTGQSVLANALLNVHLGRSWRRNGKPIPASQIDDSNENKDWQLQRHQYAKYVELLSWFMDEPSTACPFGVHRMAREGKRLGKEVGEWFGPSTAAGAIKKLVDEFAECGLGVSVASDGVIYLDQVKVQASKSHLNGQKRASVLHKWERPILILIGVRLGLEGVHPMYHDSIKATFSFPQSVGIAGGRPSSSYYFVGYQGNSLFYLDPHHVRSSIAFKHPPPSMEKDDEWWAQAYSEQELATFHNDRPRRMPMKSLDPSMLLGFLIQDEDDLHDFVVRVKALPRPIFSVLDCMPKWMMDDLDDDFDAEEKAIESISESSADDFELESEKSNATPEKDNIERNAQSIATVGKSSSPERSSEEKRKDTLKALMDPKGKASSSRPKQQRKLTPTTSSMEEPLSQSTNSAQTPRLEGTFEFVSPHTNEVSNASELPPVPSKKSTPIPIAFPTFASRDEEYEASPNETFDVGSYDESKAVHSISSEEPEQNSSEHTAKSESVVLDTNNDVQVIEDAGDEDSAAGPLSGLGENDIDATWEDLEDDLRCSPRVDDGRWSHADAIVQRAVANYPKNENTRAHNLEFGDDEDLHS